MENIITVTFDVESEAYKAFTELRNKPVDLGYSVAEASLLKREGDTITISDSFDASGSTSDDTTAGLLIGSVVGLLGGPLGVLLGAGAGALIGSTLDSRDAADSTSMLEMTAAKLYDGEVAIVAMVQEEEPAIEAAFSAYKTTIVRRPAKEVMEEVKLAREAAADFENKLREKLRDERKAEIAEKREEVEAKVQDRIDEGKAKIEDAKAALDEGKEIADAQFTSSTKEMMGTE